MRTRLLKSPSLGECCDGGGCVRSPSRADLTDMMGKRGPRLAVGSRDGRRVAARPRATDPDRVAIRVVNTVFGGRFTSQLNEALRVESGYTYGAESFFDDRKMPGPFAIFSFTKNETTTPAIDLALQVLEKLHKDGVTEAQLKSAKSYIKGQFPPNIETSRQLARIIASHEFYGLGDDEINQLEAHVDAVTPEIARQVIQKHFPAENLVFVLIGKASAVGPAVKKYAATQDMRPISDPGFWPAPVASKK